MGAIGNRDWVRVLSPVCKHGVFCFQAARTPLCYVNYLSVQFFNVVCSAFVSAGKDSNGKVYFIDLRKPFLLPLLAQQIDESVEML